MLRRPLALLFWSMVAAALALPKASLAALPKRLFVLDETNIITPATEAYLDKVLRRLQEDTGLKVRVIAPPAGLQNDREKFKEYLKPITKDWGTDNKSLVIVAEERLNKRNGRQLPLMTIQPGFRLQERFQYRLTQDYILGVADKFGFPTTVNETGTDLAIKSATQNVAACLFSLAATKDTRYLLPLSEQEVATFLSQHGL